MSVFDSALAQIKDLQPYLPGKPVEELERELGITEAIKLASNENPLGCPKRARDAIESASAHVELYPDANAYYLKQALAARLGVNANQLTIGNGSNDVLDLVARSFLDAGAEAIVAQYAFMVYAMVTQACGAGIQVARALGPEQAQPYGHDLESMLALVNERTRVIFIANPNNPTGTWIDRGSLKSFIEKVPPHIAIVIDEAYFEYVDLADYPDSTGWLERHPNLIVTRTFSKIYGLAGLRLGYAIASPELTDLFNRVRQPFNANALALAAAQAALADDEFVARSREVNRAGLALLQDFCHQRGLEFIPSVGNFISVKFAQNCQAIYQGLLQRGVIVRPIANYDLPEHLRITIGTATQLDRLFTALDEIL